MNILLLAGCLFGTLMSAALVSAGVTSSPPAGAISPSPATYSSAGMKYDYGKALSLSHLFYDAQRTGRLPSNNPIGWRGDSFVNDADGIDLSGGWFDAGDHVKFNFPMAFSVWYLNWGFLTFADAYKAAGLTEMYCDMIKWPLDYFLKCWKPDSNRLYTQVGDAQADHQHWASPETIQMNRPAHSVDNSCPGSEVAADTASSFATGYLVFKDHCGDTSYAEKLKSAAISLYKFANDHRGSYSRCYSDASSFYNSDGYMDELTAAGVFMYKATNEQSYLDDAAQAFGRGLVDGIEWNNKGSAAALLMYEATMEDRYKTNVTSYMSYIKPNGGARYTPCGLVYLDRWGTARHSSNVALLALIAAADGIEPDENKKWALSQINYILGDNNYGISYEVGFGNHYPTHYHHRGSSCNRNAGSSCSIDAPGENPNLLYGALVGGPDQNDQYSDDRSDYVHNEVAVDFNAGFQGALAGLVSFANNGDLPSSPAPKC